MKRRPLRVLVVLGLAMIAGQGAPAAGSGACCVDGFCLPNLDEVECSNLGGLSQGTGTTCPADGFCAGACCVALVCSTDLTKSECEALPGGGVFQGGQSVCVAEDDEADELCTVGFTGRTVSTGVLGVTSVAAADLDGDGDVDLLSASADDDEIAWYENEGGTPASFTEHVIATNADGARSVVAADLDGDGDLDVLSASQNDDKIAWYESDGASPPAFIARIITGDRVLGATNLALAIPDDGYPGSGVSHTLSLNESFTLHDVDLALEIAHTYVGDLVVEVEHLGTTVTLINQPGDASDTIGDPFGCDQDNYDVTLDDEGDGGAIEDQCAADLSSPPSYTPNATLSAFDGLDAAGDWTITVFDSAGADTGTLDGWTLRISGASTEGFAEGVASVAAADVDGDGDLDVLSAAPFADTHCSDDFGTRCVSDEDCLAGVCAQTLAWYENDGGSPPAFTAQLIPGDRFGPDAHFVAAADLDDDSDMDVIATSGGLTGEGVCSLDPAQNCSANEDCPQPDVCMLTRSIAWYENNGASNPGFVEHLIRFDIGANLFPPAVADVDRDGDLDIVAAASGDAALAWYENNGAFPPVFIPHVVSRDVLSVFALSVADLDADGDPDIAAGMAGSRCGGETTSPGELCTSANDCSGANPACIAESRVGWYENLGGAPPVFSPRTRRITNDLANFQSLVVTDVDRDGDVDLVSASSGDDKISWYENARGLDVVNLDTGRQFGTIAAAVASAGPAHTLSAAPTRFDSAEPVIDFRSKALTLQSRGAITQPSGGLYTLANNSLLRTAAGNWDVTLRGELVVPTGARAEVQSAGFSLLGTGSGLTASADSHLSVASGATLEGTTTVGGNAELAFASDVAIDGAADLQLGSALTVVGKLDLTAGSVLTASGGELTSTSDLQLGGQTVLGTGSIVRSGGALGLAFGSTLDASGADVIAAGTTMLEGTLNLSAGASLSAGADFTATMDSALTLGFDSALSSVGDLSFGGPTLLQQGSSVSSGAILALSADAVVSATGADLLATADAKLDGQLTLGPGARLDVGGALFLEDNGVASLSTSGAELFIAGDAVLGGPVNLGSSTVLVVGGVLDAPQDTAMTPITIGSGTTLDIAQETTVERPLRLGVNASLDTGGFSLMATSQLSLEASASVLASDDVVLDAPANLSVGSLLAADGAITNASEVEFLDADLSAGAGFTNMDSLVGFGAIAADFINDTLAVAVFKADTVVVGDYTNGTPEGQCDDAEPDAAAAPCTTDAACGVGVCAEIRECDANAPTPSAACTDDLECSPGLCIAVGNECSADSAGGLAGTACTEDGDCRIGTCLNAETTVEEGATLIILGTLTNYGTMNGPGTIQPPPTATAGHHTAAAPLSEGFFIQDDLVAAATASLMLSVGDPLVEIGGHWDVSIRDSNRVDLTRAEVRLGASGGQVQRFEVMSRDQGPTAVGLSRKREGHFPIGTLRIGPTPTTVQLVDEHDNDRLGQAVSEVVYVRSLVIESGSLLLTSGHTVYYGTLVLDGDVDRVESLVELAPLLEDIDSDLDVDLFDYSLVVECMKGPNQSDSIGVCPILQFDQTDFDGDDDVDLVDMRLFQNAFTGR